MADCEAKTKSSAALTAVDKKISDGSNKQMAENVRSDNATGTDIEFYAADSENVG